MYMRYTLIGTTILNLEYVSIKKMSTSYRLRDSVDYRHYNN